MYFCLCVKSQSPENIFKQAFCISIYTWALISIMPLFDKYHFHLRGTK